MRIGFEESKACVKLCFQKRFFYSTQQNILYEIHICPVLPIDVQVEPIGGQHGNVLRGPSKGYSHFLFTLKSYHGSFVCQLMAISVPMHVAMQKSHYKQPVIHKKSSSVSI